MLPGASASWDAQTPSRSVRRPSGSGTFRTGYGHPTGARFRTPLRSAPAVERRKPTVSPIGTSGTPRRTAPASVMGAYPQPVDRAGALSGEYVASPGGPLRGRPTHVVVGDNNLVPNHTQRSAHRIQIRQVRARAVRTRRTSGPSAAGYGMFGFTSGDSLSSTNTSTTLN